MHVLYMDTPYNIFQDHKHSRLCSAVVQSSPLAVLFQGVHQD